MNIILVFVTNFDTNFEIVFDVGYTEFKFQEKKIISLKILI